MAKVTVKIKLPTIDKLNKDDIATRKFQKKLGTEVLEEVLDEVSIGKSPVKGQGRYPGYKVDRASASARKRKTPRSNRKVASMSADNSFYPNSVKDKFPGKQKRPVNLKLSGKFLSKVNWKRIKGGVELGLMSRSEKLRKMFETHNDGSHRHVPRRAIIPTGMGEKFTAKISRLIKDIYLERIKEMTKKSRR